MKILLRNKQTGLFYSITGQWTDQVECAFDFKSGLSAVRHVLACCLDGIEFVYSVAGPGKSLLLPPDAILTRCE